MLDQSTKDEIAQACREAVKYGIDGLTEAAAARGALELCVEMLPGNRREEIVRYLEDAATRFDEAARRVRAGQKLLAEVGS